MSKHAPVIKWHPETGKPQTFNNADEAPAGFVDEHPNNMEPEDRKAAIAKLRASKPEKVEKAKPMTRKEIVATLTDGGILFDGKADTATLEGVLVDAIKAHLTAVEIEFSNDADTRDLLALVPKPE